MTRYYVLLGGRLYPCSSLETAISTRDRLTGTVSQLEGLRNDPWATSPTRGGKRASGLARGENGRVSPHGTNGKTDQKPKKKTKPPAKTPRKPDKAPGQCLYGWCKEPATMTFGEGFNFCSMHTRGAAKVLHKAPTYIKTGSEKPRRKTQ